MSRKYMGQIACAALAATLLLAGCSARNAAPGSGEPPQQSDSGDAAGQDAPAPVPEEREPEGGQDSGGPVNPGPEEYIRQLVQETVAQFYEPGMSEFERTKAAFDYMIETISLIDPVGLDLWRIRCGDGAPPSFVENRSLSVLLFHLGKCEDYAAALTMLLQGMGLEAEYVPGLTYSTQGALVDHAWTMVQVDGVWYHLDCQLEQNISRHGSIRYKYFMRSDATMASSHRWSQNLIDSRLLTDKQNEEIARDFMLPSCPQDYPTPERHAFTAAGTPDVAAIEGKIAAEFAAYEGANGPLEPMEINIVPPVFALEGYGPQD